MTDAQPKHRRRGRSLAALAVAALALAACGDDGGETTGSAAATSAPAAAGSTTTSAAAATDGTTAGSTAGSAAPLGEACPADGDPEATLRYGAANLPPPKMDPHMSANGYDQNWLAPVYERLIWQTPSVELVPGLATEWAFEDDLHMSMTLREGVMFTDGTPFNGQAVADNIERAKTITGGGLVAYLASVDHVEVVDDTHVTFVLSRPDATLPNQLATRPGMMLSPGAFDNPDLTTKPVGTGPYQLVELRDGEFAAYERNPDYWRPGYACVRRIEMTYIPESNTRLNALRSGQIDAGPIDNNQIDEVKGISDLQVSVNDAIQLYHFQLDRTKSEFGNPLVRRAMAHALDREAIVQALVAGYGTPATQWVAPGTPYYDDSLGESTTYDPDRSRELLAEAGLPDGFSFNALTSVQPLYVTMAEVIQSQFAEVGINMDVQQSPNLADAFFVQQATDAIVSAYPGRIDPSETAQIYFNDESFSNPGRQNDPEVQQAWIDSLVPGADRPAKLKALLQAIDTAMPNIPLFYPKIALASTQNVHGLVYYQSGHIEFAGVTVTP